MKINFGDDLPRMNLWSQHSKAVVKDDPIFSQPSVQNLLRFYWLKNVKHRSLLQRYSPQPRKQRTNPAKWCCFWWQCQNNALIFQIKGAKTFQAVSILERYFITTPFKNSFLANFSLAAVESLLTLFVCQARKRIVLLLESLCFGRDQ